MPTIVDMRPPANTFRHATLIVIWMVVCLVGLGGCKSNLVKETCTDRPVWTTVVAKDCYTETVNQQTHTVYELTLIADGRDNQFKLRVDKSTYDRAFINNKSNRLSFNLNRSDYGTGWEPLIYKEEDYLRLGTSYLDHNTWLIAAPYDTMENNIRIEIFSKAEEDRKRRLEDPIVFRATKIGIVIVSMWGEEASDSMFDKYR